MVEIDQWTQARNLREVEPMARDLIATLLEVEPSSFEVAVELGVSFQRAGQLLNR
ncbi:hypothetical protein [Nocardia lasii]|uniref:Uncharacterized protein n=1 Tax=Nocardia lasii TaxID=1616107 RepID=A0ABW1JQR0_9NOCA